MFHFPDEIDWNLFFRFDKRWIGNLNWARISPSAKAVFPVIACHCNKDGIAFPGEETISALAGRSAKIVRQGIKDLEGFPGFDWKPYLTQRGKRGKKFFVKFPKPEKGRCFFFYRGVIDGGIWRKNSPDKYNSGLTPAAQALYPVMRYFSRYDVYEDERLDDLDDPLNVPEFYADRQWELCVADVGQLAKYAGIDRHTVTGAIKSLRDNFLLSPHKMTDTGEKAWKVFIKPRKYWKSRYLNEKLLSEKYV